MGRAADSDDEEMIMPVRSRPVVQRSDLFDEDDDDESEEEYDADKMKKTARKNKITQKKPRGRKNDSSDEEGADSDDEIDDSDASDESESGESTDLDASGSEEAADDSDSEACSDGEDEEAEIDIDSEDEMVAKKSPKIASKKSKARINLSSAIPSAKTISRHLKKVKTFMAVVDDTARRENMPLWKAIETSKKSPDQEDLVMSITALDDAVTKFSNLLTTKLKATEQNDLAIVVERLMTECTVLAASEYAPSLVSGHATRACVVSGKTTDTRLAVYVDRFKKYANKRADAKAKDLQRPEWVEDAPPDKLNVPATAGTAPLLVQLVVAGSIRQAYNPLLQRVTVDAISDAAHNAFCDIATYL